MIRRVELTGDVTYDGNGNAIAVNGKQLAHREPTAACKTAIKTKLISEVEAELEMSSVLGGSKFKNEKGLYIRGSENDYEIAVVAKKETMDPFKGAPSGTPMTIAIVNRISKAVGNSSYKLVGINSNGVRVNTAVGDFEVKVTKKKDRQ